MVASYYVYFIDVLVMFELINDVDNTLHIYRHALIFLHTGSQTNSS